MAACCYDNLLQAALFLEESPVTNGTLEASTKKSGANELPCPNSVNGLFSNRVAKVIRWWRRKS